MTATDLENRLRDIETVVSEEGLAVAGQYVPELITDIRELLGRDNRAPHGTGESCVNEEEAGW